MIYPNGFLPQSVQNRTIFVHSRTVENLFESINMLNNKMLCCGYDF